jgi:hypothetical protein
MVTITQQGWRTISSSFHLQGILDQYYCGKLDLNGTDNLKIRTEIRRIGDIPDSQLTWQDVKNYYYLKQAYYVKKICESVHRPELRVNLTRYSKKIDACAEKIEDLSETCPNTICII